MAAAEDALRALLASEGDRFERTEDGRLRCTLNGHTMPATVDAVSAFLKGKKYAKLKAAQSLETLMAKYDPILSQSINFPDRLFCCLTNDLVEKTPGAIQRHVGGKRFARAKARVAADEQEPFEEPDFSKDPPSAAEEASGDEDPSDAIDIGDEEDDPELAQEDGDKPSQTPKRHPTSSRPAGQHAPSAKKSKH